MPLEKKDFSGYEITIAVSRSTQMKTTAVLAEDYHSKVGCIYVKNILILTWYENRSMYQRCIHLEHTYVRSFLILSRYKNRHMYLRCIYLLRFLILSWYDE